MRDKAIFKDGPRAMIVHGGHRNLDIRSLSIISSCGCNLKCSYCVIAQSENNHSSELQQATMKALQDGSFLENCVNSLLALNQSPSKIEKFSLWGQEPTLTLHLLAEHWEDWAKNFPNIDNLFFSTNGMAYGERIVDFLKAVDKYATHTTAFQVQISYDGDYGTNSVRNADSIQIENNIKKLVTLLNDCEFKYLKVMLCFHGVMSQELIKTLTDGDTTQEYFNNASNWVAGIGALNRNPDVIVEPGVGYIYESPIDASTEDGINLASFYKKMIKVNPKKVTNTSGNYEAHSLLSAYQRSSMAFARSIYPGFEEMMQTITSHPQDFQKFVEIFSNGSYCGTFYGELKMMYDGTIIGCQNTMYERNPADIKNDGSVGAEARVGLARHSTFFVNPLTDSEDHIHTIFNMFRDNRESSFLFNYGNTINLMLWLREAHQIDESYKNTDKLMAHAFYLSLLNGCVYNNYVQTGTFYGISTGTIRYFCNGFLDCVFDNDDVWGGQDRWGM